MNSFIILGFQMPGGSEAIVLLIFMFLPAALMFYITRGKRMALRLFGAFVSFMFSWLGFAIFGFCIYFASYLNKKGGTPKDDAANN